MDDGYPDAVDKEHPGEGSLEKAADDGPPDAVGEFGSGGKTYRSPFGAVAERGSGQSAPRDGSGDSLSGLSLLSEIIFCLTV